MSHSDITFYIGTLASVAMLFGLLWKLTIGDPLKRLRDQTVTKEDLLKELMSLREWLRKEFVSKK